MIRLGDALVIIVGSVLLGVIGYKVIGWWAPGIILTSYVVGTYLNTKLSDF